MRFITGQHRAEYEVLIAKAALADHLALEVEVLQGHIRSLEKRVEAERTRAERAIDAQLSVRGFPPVTPPDDSMPELPDGLAEDPEKVAASEKRILAGDTSVFAERF